MNMTTAIGGTEQSEFLRSIEGLLRKGDADEAARQLKSQLSAFAGEGKILPARMLEIAPQDIVIAGWDDLAGKLAQYDRPEHPISAIGIDLANPDERGLRPVEQGHLAPPVETSFYSDDAYPFSACDLESLLDGYSAYGTEWQGSADQEDTTISVEGLDDLYGAVIQLQAEDSSGLPATPEELEAFAIGSCYIAVLVHLAVRETITAKGLPRPLAIFVGNNESFPFFDAPVIAACNEDGEPFCPKIAEAAEQIAPIEEPVSVIEPVNEASPEEPEEAVLDLEAFSDEDFEDEEDEYEEDHDDSASLLGMRMSSPRREVTIPSHAVEPDSEAETDEPQEQTVWPISEGPVTGSQLRRRISDVEAQEAEEASRKPGLLARLFGLA